VSIFKTSLKSNKWIWLGIASQISIISFLIYAPQMQALFGTASLGPFEWAFLALLAAVIVFVEEIRKWFTRRLTK
jgi:magnesium-transporting ATPase (P-type)